MTFAAVAIGGAGLVGGGMVTQGYFANKSSKRASKAAANAMDSYLSQMRQGRDSALTTYKPYYTAGTQGLNSLSGLLTGKDSQGNTLSEQERMNTFQKSPGYQFRLDQAQNALTASQAARGGLLSGGAMKEMNAYTQGIASDEYGNYINQLSGLAGIGQNAATGMANAELFAGSNMANASQQGVYNSGMAMANRDAQMGNIFGGTMQQVGGQMLGIGMGGMGSGTKSPSGFSSAGGGQYNNSVFSGSNMPNTNLQSGRF